MTTAAEADISEDRFLGAVSAICAKDPRLAPLGAAVLLANYLGIARNSRTFARKLGVEHALVLREVTTLSGLGGLITIVERNARTQRTELSITPEAADLVRHGLT
jgi:hypothetical protein